MSKTNRFIADDRNSKSGFDDAPVVITLWGAKNILYGKADCFVAAENMTLAAHSLGLGSCIIGRAYETFSSEYERKVIAPIKGLEGFVPFCHVLVGYANRPELKAKARQTDRVFFLEE